MIEYRFKHCRVTINDAAQRVETVFDDRAVVAALPVFGEESVARARALGYRGSDEEAVWAMTRHHDLTHTVIAEAQGHPYSPTLHAVGTTTARRPGSPSARSACVFLVQRLLNGGLDTVIADALVDGDWS